MHMLKEVGEPAKAAEWLKGKFDHKALVMGFGHRVYKTATAACPP
jgi:citrate synthase